MSDKVWVACMLSSFALENPLPITSSMQHPFLQIRAEQRSSTRTLLVCSLPYDTQVHSVSIISVLSVCVCEAWLFWFTEKLCWMSVSLRWDASQVLLCCTLCMHGHSYTQCLPLSDFLELAPTNRPLNLTHIQQMQTHKQPDPQGVFPSWHRTCCHWVCVSPQL